MLVDRKQVFDIMADTLEDVRADDLSAGPEDHPVSVELLKNPYKYILGPCNTNYCRNTNNSPGA